MPDFYPAQTCFKILMSLQSHGQISRCICKTQYCQLWPRDHVKLDVHRVTHRSVLLNMVIAFVLWRLSSVQILCDNDSLNIQHVTLFPLVLWVYDAGSKPCQLMCSRFPPSVFQSDISPSIHLSMRNSFSSACRKGSAQWKTSVTGQGSI